MAILFVIISSLLFGVIPSVQNIAIKNGAGSLLVTLTMDLVCVSCNLLLCLFRKTSLKIRRRDFLFYLLAGAVGIFFTDFFLAEAYRQMPVGLVTMIHFTYPLLVSVINMLLFGEKMDGNKAAAVVFSLTGLFLLGGHGGGSLSGMAFALLSAIAYALYLICIDRSPIEGHDVFKKNFYIYLCSMFSSLFFGIRRFADMSFQYDQVFYLFLAGVMLTIGSICLNIGIRSLGSSTSAFLSTLEPVTSLFVSTMINRYVLLLRSILGCISILFSLFPIIRSSKEKDNL